MVKNSIIWIVALAVALASGLTAMGAIAKDKAPELAISLPPVNGFAAAKIASNSVKAAIAENAGQFPDHVDPRAIELARAAFVAEPVVPDAIAILALEQASRYEGRLMSSALSLSRRQPLVTAWMIIDSGARKDMPALLKHYDTLLRTNSSAGALVIPMLVEALATADFVDPFASVFRKQPPWASRFWATVVGTPEALGNAADLREMLHRPNEPKSFYHDGSLILALVNARQFEKAESLYRRLVGRKRTDNLLENGSFTETPEYFPIDWQLFSTGEFGSAITGGKLEISAINNSGGLLVRQLVKLPARMVSLDIKPGNPISQNAAMMVSLKCAQQVENAPQAIRIPLTSKITDLQIDNSRSGCNYYWFDIEGKASGDGDGFDITLDSVSLR